MTGRRRQPQYRPARAARDASELTVDDIVVELDLQRTIERMLEWAGLPFFHDEDARRNKAGFPDLWFPRPPVLHAWELKTMAGELEPEQITWRDALEACTSIDYRVVRPTDLDWVRKYLGLDGA